MISEPLGEKATDTIQLEWPFRDLEQVPSTISQTRVVQSADPETRREPSGEKYTDITQPEWPSRVATQLRLTVSQIRMVLSFDPEASFLLSLGQKATDLTDPE